MTDPYRAFLEEKIVGAPAFGFHVELDQIHPWLKPHARALVQWGLAGGRRAFFTSYGLHKTSIQLETCRQVLLQEGGKALIVLPLGVRQEFWNDASQMGIPLPKFIRTTEEADAEGAIYLTNYESVREGKIDPKAFTVASLDEADVLRSYGSKTFQTFLPLFDEVKYRFVATATPDPNRHKELIHYAGFLGVMDTGQALTRFFQRNSEKANDLTLYPHKTKEFWLWVHSWAMFLQKPSDLGFSDDGYEMPELIVRWHEVKADLSDAGAESNGQMRLMRDAAMGLQEAAREKRSSLTERIAKGVELRNAEPENNFLLWHDLEDERRAIEAAIPNALSVYGTQDLLDRENIILGFKNGDISDLAAKPIMLGAGPNFQPHCHRAIFFGIGSKFRDFIQAVHRILRFGQKQQVIVDLIYAETERNIRRNLEAKWAKDREQRAIMSAIIREYGLSHISAQASLARSIGIERAEADGRGWAVVNNDCVDETQRMAADSVDLVVTSVPFSNHYEYTPSYNDFGHTDGDAHFFEQMDFLTPQLLRILRPGRLACVHVKDRIMFGSVTGHGVPTVNPFHAKTLFHYVQHGFQFMGMIHINTDVVRENNQTYRLGYSEMMKDSTKMGVGSSEYVLLMRKPQSDRSRGYADVPVTKDPAGYSLARWQVDAHAFWRSSGNRLMTPAELASLQPDVLSRLFTDQTLRHVYDSEAHIATGEALAARDALPKTFMALAPGSHDPNIWHDINRMGTLNTAQAASGREKHICPLQFDIVDRLIRRYSDEGDLVFDPFMGIGTVPLRALRLKRRGAGTELNADYFRDGVRYLKAQDAEMATPSLFDLMDEEKAA
jgi:DNA modification methylase